MAFRISKAQKHIEICRKDKTRRITEEILRLALTGIQINKLKEISVVGLDKKIQYLMNDKLTWDQLEQVLYELS